MKYLNNIKKYLLYAGFLVVFISVITIIIIYGYQKYFTYPNSAIKIINIFNTQEFDKLDEDDGNRYKYSKNIYREDLEKLIPDNYSLVINVFTGQALKVIEIKTGNAFMYLLPLTFVGNETMNNFCENEDKIILLSYDEEINGYKIADEFSAVGKVTINDYVDIDFDNEKELFTVFSWSCGSGTHHDNYILDIDYDNEKINVINQLDSISMINTDYFFERDGLITSAMFIWDIEKGESHFGCHYFNIYQYKYDIDENKIKKIKTIHSKNKYTLDIGESKYEEYWLKSCFPLPNNFEDFLKKESINY